MSPVSDAPCAKYPRFLVSAASSGSGKTVISLGLIAAFRRRGLEVAAAKVGPDFIDCAHLARASGRPARNLDAFLASEKHVVTTFLRGASTASMTIIEGAMGLFDGRHGSGTGSSAHVARLLEASVILVLDCAHSSATIGAVALGLQRFDPHVNVAGVILNRVASPRHRQTVVDAVQSAGIAVLGVIPRDENLVLSSRHLGLTGPDHPGWTSVVDAAATSMERNVDLDAIEALANAAPPLHAADDIGVRENTGRSVRIAVARDEAFWFYDYTTLETLTDIGAELVYYSPLHDDFPAVDAAFIGGGYPELHATGLAANTAALRSFRDRISAGMPTYAECGGLMYLCDALHVGNERVELVGAIPAAVTMREKRTALRYVQAETLTDGPMFIRGQDVRGHEFHYSSIEYERSSYAYSFDDEREGFSNANVHASYLHLHLGAQRHALERFVNAAKNFGGCA